MNYQPHSHYDVIVIGAGPAGSTLSTLLVRQGYKVLVIEREKFPRFHIGESLLPSTQQIWERLGIAEKMQFLGNTFKYAGEIRFGSDPHQSGFEYSGARFNNLPRKLLQDRPYGYQVERAEFDLFLLDNAREQGVVVCEEAVVKEILWEDGDRPSQPDSQSDNPDNRVSAVRWRTKDGTEHVTRTECVADCSGRHAFIARNWQFLVNHPEIKTSAVFGHFKNVARDEGIRQGYVQTYFIEDGWMWFIPIHPDRMSFGVVMNQTGTGWWSKKSPEEILYTYINRYKFIRDRFENAEQCDKVRILSQLSYYSTRTVGNGWILVGDANFFVDPLFSSGVHAAFHTAEKAAAAIDQFLQGDRDMKPFKQYESWGKKYQFHLFTTVGYFYKMMRYRFAVDWFVRLTGKYIGNNFVRRRLVSWISGYFEQYYWALYVGWGLILSLVGLGWLREKLFRIPRWDGYNHCTEAPLMVAKSPEMTSNYQQNGHQNGQQNDNHNGHHNSEHESHQESYQNGNAKPEPVAAGDRNFQNYVVTPGHW
jgi:flavin-dependent dehydrogenase